MQVACTSFLCLCDTFWSKIRVWLQRQMTSELITGATCPKYFVHTFMLMSNSHHDVKVEHHEPLRCQNLLSWQSHVVAQPQVCGSALVGAESSAVLFVICNPPTMQFSGWVAKSWSYFNYSILVAIEKVIDLSGTYLTILVAHAVRSQVLY